MRRRRRPTIFNLPHGFSLTKKGGWVSPANTYYHNYALGHDARNLEYHGVAKKAGVSTEDTAYRKGWYNLSYILAPGLEFNPRHRWKTVDERPVHIIFTTYRLTDKQKKSMKAVGRFCAFSISQPCLYEIRLLTNLRPRSYRNKILHSEHIFEQALGERI